jgi:hypothetical protein
MNADSKHFKKFLSSVAPNMFFILFILLLGLVLIKPVGAH